MDVRKERALAVAHAIIDAAVNLAAIVPKAFPSKRKHIFSKHPKTPKRRIERTSAKVQMALNTRLAYARIYALASQPLPKDDYPSGGLTIIAEQGDEYITTPDGNQIKA